MNPEELQDKSPAELIFILREDIIDERAFIDKMEAQKDWLDQIIRHAGDRITGRERLIKYYQLKL